jgi:acetaldehyde dehydrogenase
VHLDAPNVNMVTCGGQATIPMVAAVASVAEVHYAEIVASIASKSAGPGTRANIDEFTETTSRGIEQVGGAARGKAIIILNPAEPPMIMRDTIFTCRAAPTKRCDHRLGRSDGREGPVLCAGLSPEAEGAVRALRVEQPRTIPGYGTFEGLKTAIFIEVEGAAHYLPAYAGNLDIMTSAALRTAEKIAASHGAPERRHDHVQST